MNFLGGIEVVANEYSKRATETVVSLGDKMRHLGTAGNEKRISQIKATATNFKRLIGLPWEHHVVQSMASGTFAAPYKLIKCNETGGAAVQLPDGNVYAIQQVMAMFLGKMKEIAEGWFQNIFCFEIYSPSLSTNNSRIFLEIFGLDRGLVPSRLSLLRRKSKTYFMKNSSVVCPMTQTVHLAYKL